MSRTSADKSGARVNRLADRSDADTRTVREVRWAAGEIHTQKMQAVGQLAGGVAHDLSNLMTAMFGWLEIASSQLPADHAARESMKMVQRAARQADGLTRSLLTFSRRAPTERRRFLLNEAVRGAARLLARLLPASIEQSWRIPDEPVWVDGDDAQIQQVLMNLALNARDAIDGCGRLTVALEVRSASEIPARADGERLANGVAVLRVSDSGCGMPESVRSRAFEPFFTTKARDRGTGLGLAIVHAIVDECGGWMDLETEVGRGSVFSVNLPRREAPSAEGAGRDGDSIDLPRGLGVLIIEDNAHVRAMLTTVLVDAGCMVFEAGDGAAGVTLFEERAEDIDIAIVDIDLPKMGGLEVLGSMFEKNPSTRGIVITGYPPTADALERIETMGWDLLRKPFQVSELKQWVARATCGRR